MCKDETCGKVKPKIERKEEPGSIGIKASGQNLMSGKKPSYALVVTEKPSVAKSIAKVIGARENKDGYMEGNGYLVSWCVGHLVELAQPESYGEEWKKWTYDSLPIKPKKWQHELKPDTKAQYDVLYRLMHRQDVSAAICATDVG